MPDSSRWGPIDDKGERLRIGLAEIYGWYRQTRSMTANVLRDAQTIPALHSIIAGGLLKNLDRLADTLSEPFYADGTPTDRVRLAARAAISFEFWTLLESLGDDEAAKLGAGLVALSAGSQ